MTPTHSPPSLSSWLRDDPTLLKKLLRYARKRCREELDKRPYLPIRSPSGEVVGWRDNLADLARSEQQRIEEAALEAVALSCCDLATSHISDEGEIFNVLSGNCRAVVSWQHRMDRRDGGRDGCRPDLADTARTHIAWLYGVAVPVDSEQHESAESEANRWLAECESIFRIGGPLLPLYWAASGGSKPRSVRELKAKLAECGADVPLSTLHNQIDALRERIWLMRVAFSLRHGLPIRKPRTVERNTDCGIVLRRGRIKTALRWSDDFATCASIANTLD